MTAETPPKLDCPCCLCPTVPATWSVPEDGEGDEAPRWLWWEGDEADCPNCGCKVGIEIYYAGFDENAARTTIVRGCSAWEDNDA